MLPGVKQKESDLVPNVMRQIWVFLAYVAAARLAILLALPPGYASPIWPAAGLAMAAVIVWGPSLTLAVFLGSIVTNLRPEEFLQNPTDQIIIQLCLGLGSSIQAYLGSLIFHALKRRWPHQASPERLAAETLLLGPVACITAATIGVAALTAFHVIEAKMSLSNWFSWWLGDSFGAGVLAPILVRLHQNFHPKQLRMKVAPYLLVPAGISILIVSALVIHLNSNNRLHHKTLEHEVADFHQRLEQDASRLMQTLQNLAQNSRMLDPPAVLERYAATEKNGVQILWVPRVPEENRQDFEKSLGNAHQHFTILEKTPAGHLAPALKRSTYWPLVFKTTHELYLLAPGFDLGSITEIDSILQKAWDGLTPISSPIVTLGLNKKAILVVQRGFTPEGSSFPQGLFIALLPLEQLLKPALTHLNHPIYHIQIQAAGQASSYANWFGINASDSKHIHLFGEYKKSLALANQNLTLQVEFPAAAFHSGRMGDPLFVTTICMLLAFALNILSISQQGIAAVVNPQAPPLKDELRLQYEALRDADRNKAQLLSNMSHQIKSPLQGILGLLDMLRGSNLDQKQRSSVDTIIANCHSMRLILDDVNTYASMETGQLVLAADDFLLEDCLRDLTSVYEIAAEERQNEFKSLIEVPAKLRIQGDRRRIHRVLSHLLSDAIRRTQKGRISLKVNFQTDQSLVFTLDSQRGPHDDVHDNEWEFGNIKNWQALEVFNLKICERIIQAMGGRMTLERPSPLISRVTLVLSLPTTLPQETTPLSHETYYQDVLVVDDNAINLTVAAGLLTKLGYSVDTAGNGREALDKVKQKRYDVIFMDCQMPEMDGFEATQHIRSLHRPERGPLIIALTANDLEGVREQALQSGMDTLIMKPISLETLAQTVGYAKKKAPPTANQATPIMDFKAFSLGLGDDSDLIQTAVQRYFEEIDGMMARLRSEVERKDAPSVAKAAHTLKGMTSLFAAHALVEANRNLEMAGKEGRSDEFAGLLKRVENLTELLKMELRKLLDDRSPTRKDVA